MTVFDTLLPRPVSAVPAEGECMWTGEVAVRRTDSLPTESYRLEITQAGVTVTATRYLGTIHDFVMLNALGDTPAAKAAVEQATTFLHNAFTR